MTFVLNACSHGVQITEHADDYNDTVEQVENQMMLKNVIRASMRMPLHFTRIATFDGSLSSKFSSGSFANPGIGGDASAQTEIYKLTPSVETSSSPKFNMQVLASDKFFRGIMTPVRFDELKFFVEQGWPLDFIMLLFVEAIDVNSADGKTKYCEIRNDPLHDDSWVAFQKAIEVIERLGTITSKSKYEDFGPIFTAANLSAEDLIDLRAARLKLKKIGGGIGSETFRVQRGSTEQNIAIPNLNFSNRDAAKLLKDYTGPDSISLCKVEDIASISFAPDATVPLISAKIRLRSAINMIYYLGEMVRYQRIEKAPVTSRLLNNDDGRREELSDPTHLFDVRETLLADAAIRVEVAGKPYSVPSYPNNGRTTQFLTLLRQIFALNISSDEFPTSQNIRLITRSN